MHRYTKRRSLSFASGKFHKNGGGSGRDGKQLLKNAIPELVLVVPEASKTSRILFEVKGLASDVDDAAALEKEISSDQTAKLVA